MKFKEALLYAYQTRRTDGEVTDPFYLYCRLSDLCFETYEDKRKVRTFYAVDKRLCIFETLLKRGDDGEKELLDWYAVVSELLSEDSFKKLIACAVWVTKAAQFPAETAGETALKNADLPKKTACKKETVNKTPTADFDDKRIPALPKSPKITPVTVQKAEESKREEGRTLLTSPSYNYLDDTQIFLIVGAVLLAVSIMAGIITAIVGASGIEITWRAWQWLIGIVGGGWIAYALGTLIYLLNDGFVCDYYVSGLFCLGGITLVNFVLLLIFRENYKALFGCISVWGILGGATLAGVCFEDIEDGFGWAHVAVCIIILAIMLAGVIWL